MTDEEIRRIGYLVVDLIAEHLSDLPSEPAFQPVPQSLQQQFLTTSAPARGSTPDDILREFRDTIEPYPFGIGHPRFCAVAFSGDSSVTAAVGSLTQMLFVVAVLGVVFLSPAVWSIPHSSLVNPTVTGWLPSSWYVGLFESLRGSTRSYFMPLATRALVATPLTIAILLCLAGFRRQMRLALTPSASTGVMGGARVSRAVAALLIRHTSGARAAATFILLTIARNRAQQGPIAMNAAIGVAMSRH